MLTDSAKRCPRDGKRLVIDIGQDDLSGAGDLRVKHSCLHCDYTEMDHAWSRVLKTDGASRMAKIRDRLRGVEIPMDLTYEPFGEEIDV